MELFASEGEAREFIFSGLPQQETVPDSVRVLKILWFSYTSPGKRVRLCFFGRGILQKHRFMSKYRPITLSSGRMQVPVQVPEGTAIPPSADDPSVSGEQKISAAIHNPRDLPPLSECIVPGDRVVLVIDPETPALPEAIVTVIEQLQLVGQGDVHTTFLLPQDPSGSDWLALREQLPVHIQNQITVQIHDPEDETQRGYLASSSSGERIYLNRLLLDADLIITVGIAGFDSVLGFHGTTSAIYPALSDTEAIQQVRVSGHPELTPDQSRPVRTLIDEIGWLLGTQFTLQIIPDAQGGIGFALAGMPDRVQVAAQEILNQRWRFVSEQSFDLVVISVPAQGGFGWRQIGAALESVCRIVPQGGRIAIVADVDFPEGPGASMLRRCSDPDELLKPLRSDPTPDAREVIQLILALQRARLYLYSSIDGDLLEELGIFALSAPEELQRLIDASNSTAVIAGANYFWCDNIESEIRSNRRENRNDR